MFLVNSRYPRLAATPSRSGRASFTARGIPYPEVTVSICRVPLPGFSQAPECSPPTYLCRFAVRTPERLHPRLFLEAWDRRIRSRPMALNLHRISRLDPPFDRTGPLYVLEPGIPTTGSPTLLRPRWFLCQPRGARILTCFPSPTPVGLGLGPD